MEVAAAESALRRASRTKRPGVDSGTDYGGSSRLEMDGLDQNLARTGGADVDRCMGEYKRKGLDE